MLAMLAAAARAAAVSIAITPQTCLEPCDIKASITIVDYEAGREVCVSLQETYSDFVPRRSCWPWIGRRVTDVGIKNISAGSYEVAATLTEAGKRRAVAMLRVGGISGTLGTER